MPERAGDEAVEQRRKVVGEVGVGMVEMAMLPADKYVVIQRDDGWHCFAYDEQQFGWDVEHGL